MKKLLMIVVLSLFIQSCAPTDPFGRKGGDPEILKEMKKDCLKDKAEGKTPASYCKGWAY